MPEFPTQVESQIKSFTKSKVPYFFKYAKDKEDKNVEKINNSTVNRLYDIIPNKPIQFKRVTGKFDYKNLMHTKYPATSQELIDKFNELNRSKHVLLEKNKDSDAFQFNDYMRDELKKIHRSEQYIVDVLVEYLYSSGNKDKEGLWDVYGEIVYENILTNLGETISCEVCKERVEKINENSTHCRECYKEVRAEQNRKNFKRWYESKKSNQSQNDKLLIYQRL